MKNKNDENISIVDGQSNGNITKNAKRDKLLSAINITLIAIIIVLIIAVIIFVFILSPMSVSGNSMQNTLQNGDRIMILKVGNKFERGDIIVFNKPTDKQPPIKRIVAVSGEVVRFDQNMRVWLINEVPLAEDYVYFENNQHYGLDYFNSSTKEIKEKLLGQGLKVGDDEFFVLGDNRNISYDSHSYGCIKIDWIKGKLIV